MFLENREKIYEFPPNDHTCALSVVSTGNLFLHSFTSLADSATAADVPAYV